MLDKEKWINRINANEYLPGFYAGMISLPDSGDATVVVGTDEDGYEHVSVAPTNQRKLPSWDDMCYVKNIFWDEEEECYQIMPKKSEYVNIKKNCLHLWKPIGYELKDLVRMDARCWYCGGKRV